LNYVLKYLPQPRKLEQALSTLPTNVEDLYDRVMGQIIGGDDVSKDLAIRTLSWVYYGAETRLLTMKELRGALVIEVGDEVLDVRQPLESDIIAVCQSLVVCDDQTKIVRFTHYTVQEYFKHNCKDKLSPRVELAKVCVTYLAFDGFNDGYAPIRFDYDDDLPLWFFDWCLPAFYNYALQYWVYYTKGDGESDHEMRMALLRLFNSPQKRATLLRQEIRRVDYRWWRNENEIDIEKFSSKSTTWMPIHILAEAGLPTLIKSFWTNSQQAAQALEHHELDFGTVHSKDFLGATALIWAARRGHADVVKLLLEAGADKEETDEMGTSALCWSVQNGHISVVKLLLKAQVDVNSSKHAWRMTPLIIALIFGHAEIALLLLTAKANVQCKDTKLGKGPLWWCLRIANSEVVKDELLKAGADEKNLPFGENLLFRLNFFADVMRHFIVRSMFSTEEIQNFFKES